LRAPLREVALFRPSRPAPFPPPTVTLWPACLSACERSGGVPRHRTPRNNRNSQLRPSLFQVSLDVVPVPRFF